MKTLYLIRHGKGAPRADEQTDHDRPLSKIGRRDVKALGRTLRQRRIVPDVILCAPTARAGQTADIIARMLKCPPERIVTYTEAAVDDADRLLHLIRSQPDAAAAVMLIGHHPALSAVAHTLASYVDPTLRTGSIVALRVAAATWADATADAARLDFYDFPPRMEANVAQHLRRTIGAHLDQIARLAAGFDDAPLPEGVAHIIKRTSHRLAEALLPELRAAHVSAVSADQPGLAAETPQPGTDEPEPEPEPAPSKKRKQARTGAAKNRPA